MYYSNTEQQINFLKKVLDIEQSSKILDLGCDKGVHLIPLQEISKSVFGVDIKENKNNLTNYFKVNFLQDDITSINHNLKNFDSAYILSPCFEEDWNDITYFLQNVSKILKDKGILIIDLFEFNLLKDGDTKVSFKEEKEKMTYSSLVKSKNSMNLLFTSIDLKNPKNKTQTKGYWKIFSYQEISTILLRNNFVIENIYTSFDDTEGDIFNFKNNTINDRIILKCLKI